jgi:hypothetical protein
VVADWFSKELLIFTCRAAESKSLVNIMELEVFHTKGVPECIITDNSKQFVSNDFRIFTFGSLHYGHEKGLNL